MPASYLPFMFEENSFKVCKDVILYGFSIGCFLTSCCWNSFMHKVDLYLATANSPPLEHTFSPCQKDCAISSENAIINSPHLGYKLNIKSDERFKLLSKFTLPSPFFMKILSISIWKLICLFLASLIAIISFGLALSSSCYSVKESQQNSEIWKPLPFLTENGADSFFDDSHSSLENLSAANFAQLKAASHKSTKIGHLQQFQLDIPNLNRQSLKKHCLIQRKENELQETNFKNPFEFDGQDAAKRFAVFREKQEQEENSSAFGNHHQYLLDGRGGINEPRGELNAEFNQKYQSLVDKYFAGDHQEIDFKYYEEYLDLMEKYFGVDLLVQQE